MQSRIDKPCRHSLPAGKNAKIWHCILGPLISLRIKYICFSVPAALLQLLIGNLLPSLRLARPCVCLQAWNHSQLRGMELRLCRPTNLIRLQADVSKRKVCFEACVLGLTANHRNGMQNSPGPVVRRVSQMFIICRACSSVRYRSMRSDMSNQEARACLSQAGRIDEGTAYMTKGCHKDCASKIT